jgi:hypothetical protein
MADRSNAKKKPPAGGCQKVDPVQAAINARAPPAFKSWPTGLFQRLPGNYRPFRKDNNGCRRHMDPLLAA